MTGAQEQQLDVRTFKGAGLNELLPQIRAELGEDAVILARRDTVEGGLGGFFGRRVIVVDAAAPRRVDVRDEEQDDPELHLGPDGDAALPAYGVDAYAAPRAMSAAGAAAEPEDGWAPAPAPTREDGTPNPWAPTVAAAPAPAPAADPADAAAALDAAAAALRAAAAPPADADADATNAGPAPAPAKPARTADVAAFAQQLAGLMQDRPPAAAPAHRPTVDPRVDLVPPAPPAPLAVPAAPAAAAPTADLDDADALVQASVPTPELVAPPRVNPAAGLGPDGAALLATGLSPALTAELVHTATAHVAPLAQDNSPRGVLRTALAARIPVAAPVRGPGGAVIGFVGPGGSGKTRCVARLAGAYARRSSLPVACIALRAPDGGAELSALLQASGVTVHAEDDAAAAAERIDALRAETIVLLDTPAVSPRAEAELRTLAAELRRLAPDELHLTVPATMGPLAARELATAGATLGVDGIALTHVDETAALGTIIELAIDTGLPLSYVARGTAVDGGMRPAAADAIAFAMLGAPAPIDPADELV